MPYGLWLRVATPHIYIYIHHEGCWLQPKAHASYSAGFCGAEQSTRGTGAYHTPLLGKLHSVFGSIEFRLQLAPALLHYEAGPNPVWQSVWVVPILLKQHTECCQTRVSGLQLVTPPAHQAWLYHHSASVCALLTPSYALHEDDLGITNTAIQARVDGVELLLISGCICSMR